VNDVRGRHSAAGTARAADNGLAKQATDPRAHHDTPLADRTTGPNQGEAAAFAVMHSRMPAPVPRRGAHRARNHAVGRLAPVLVAALAWAWPACAADPQGVWLTEARDAAVLIAPCAGDDDGLMLCGRIVWLKDANDESGAPRRDTRNPDPARRARPICGLVVMGGLRPSGPDRWDDGSVYNPQDGRIYTGEMALLADRRLRVRAYLGMPFFGQTQVWTRADRSAAGLIEYNCRYIRVPPPAR
jgi:uncharacterized protein (DUF2147 family)